eukprot:COSAG02_NODE_1088_length_14670_cov_237.088326_7_plen_91_part_00
MLGPAPPCRDRRPFALTGLSLSATIRHRRPIPINWNWEHAGSIHSGACTRIPNLQFRLEPHRNRGNGGGGATLEESLIGWATPAAARLRF